MHRAPLVSLLKPLTLRGQIVDVVRNKIYPGALTVVHGHIAAVTPDLTAPRDVFLTPALVNAHNHVESMLVTPRQASRAVVPHGVLRMVSDPHELANVMGVTGVRYMIEDARGTTLKFLFGAPSCVPATHIGIETAGAELCPADVAELLRSPDIGYLAEVMNYPAVLARESGFMEMIAAAHALGKPVDGHAPGLRGEDARSYAAAGISTDHECFTAAEARDKIAAGMKIIVREGSAARNLAALTEIIDEFPDRTMLCTDDLHPDLALKGSIDRLVATLISTGVNPLKVFRAAFVNPNQHYRLGLGSLQRGDPADLLVVGGLDDFRVREVYSRGALVAKDGVSLETASPSAIVNRFEATPISEDDLRVPASGNLVNAIRVVEQQLITGHDIVPAKIDNGAVVADPSNDIVKIVVVNRYRPAPVSVGFVTRFGLRHGALASSVAHDCHNVVAVGANDRDLTRAINLVIEEKGGLAFVCGHEATVLPLPIGGLMSADDHATVARRYIALDEKAKRCGGTFLEAPFMTLSFLALLVIPSAKISDKGMFVDFKSVPVSFKGVLI
jgi:adenine deaminase